MASPERRGTTSATPRYTLKGNDHSLVGDAVMDLSNLTYSYSQYRRDDDGGRDGGRGRGRGRGEMRGRGRGGEGGGRGGGRGGGEGGRGGKRDFDRKSGDNRTGIKAEDKRGGGGKVIITSFPR